MWKIDRDYIAEPGEPSRVGVSGEVLHYSSIPKIRFRMLDDDSIVYYGGWLNDDPDCANQFSALSFGTYDAGCTTIEVKREGEWVQEIG